MISYFTLYKPLFVLELLIAEGLYAARLRRRKRFLLRAGLSVLFCLAVSAIPWHPKAPLELAGAFLLLFLLSCGALLCCFDAPPASILFCALASRIALCAPRWRHSLYVPCISHLLLKQMMGKLN